MAHHDTLNEMFKSSIEKWTKSSTSTETITSYALTSSEFVRPVAKITLAIIAQKPIKVRSIGRDPDRSLLSHPTYPPVMKSSVDIRIRKHATENIRKRTTRKMTIECGVKRKRIHRHSIVDHQIIFLHRQFPKKTP